MPTAAQPFSLDDCMRYAVEHSTSVGQKELDLAFPSHKRIGGSHY